MADVGQTETENENVFSFDIPNTDSKIRIDLGQIPAELRLDLLKRQIMSYIKNNVRSTVSRDKNAMKPFTEYEEAQKADPNQTAVPKPEGDPPSSDLLQIAADARQRLYENEVQRHGGGGRKRKDPLVKLVTDAVVRELFDKKRANDSSYKWIDAVKEVGGEGIEYLNRMIEDRVASGADRAELEKFRDERYIKPAQLMLGDRDTKATRDTSLL